MVITSAQQPGPGKKILIVEDEEMIRKVCQAMLSRHGFEYIMATNGANGLEAYRDRHEEICLVLSDVSMPVKSGLEMARDIFDIHSHAHCLLMSGHSMSEVIPEDLRKLCSVITKPFTAAALIESIKTCLR